MTRQEAIDTGAKRYQGKPCYKKHSGERYTSSGVCVVCNLERTKAYRQADPDRERARRAALYNKNKANERIQSRKRRGLPDPERHEPSRCECCGCVFRNNEPYLDHDHETGEFRGWLCQKCNAGIGLLGDSLKGVQLALTYLKGDIHAS